MKHDEKPLVGVTPEKITWRWAITVVVWAALVTIGVVAVLAVVVTLMNLGPGELRMP